ncbi:AfsR/SARP family transcriptional regulator [Streptomyces sp. NPDC050636]|uniref:AfsR/SARP family transcriptional regulator n=1 Tax=Streptomyces sp. NPDC050636 TaxID=3154510 RepID=UPI003419E116
MHIGLLGPMTLSHNGMSYLPTAQKPRKVLALLLMQPDRPVKVESLVEELWEEKPPASAMTTLQTYILQLRKALSHTLEITPAAVAADCLVTESGSYSFRIGSAELDLTQFEDKTRAGRVALASGAVRRAATLFREGLGLWRGPVLSDVRPGPLLGMYQRRLEEQRLTVLEQRIEADLRLGLHREVLSELTELVARNETNETLHALFMIALHRSGRRVQALDVFQQLRSYLVSNLGVDPSPKLHQLQQSILASDPALDFDGQRGLREDALLPAGAAPGQVAC